MAGMVSCVSPSFLAKNHSVLCALIPISPSHPPAAMSGQRGCLNPNSTDVSAPGMHRLHSVEFLGTHPLYNTLQESPAGQSRCLMHLHCRTSVSLRGSRQAQEACSPKWLVIVRREHRLSTLRWLWGENIGINTHKTAGACQSDRRGCKHILLLQLSRFVKMLGSEHRPCQTESSMTHSQSHGNLAWSCHGPLARCVSATAAQRLPFDGC